jgi:hypothetical protein
MTESDPETPDPEVSIPSGPADVARALLRAVLWSEHLDVWDALHPDAREHVLAAAARHGLDPVAAERIRQGTWSAGERDDFLRGLVHGLRVDLSGAEISTLQVADEDEPIDAVTVRCRLEAPSVLPNEITGGAAWDSGAIVLRRSEDMTWRVLLVEGRRATSR